MHVKRAFWFSVLETMFLVAVCAPAQAQTTIASTLGSTNNFQTSTATSWGVGASNGTLTDGAFAVSFDTGPQTIWRLNNIHIAATWYSGVNILYVGLWGDSNDLNSVTLLETIPVSASAPLSPRVLTASSALHPRIRPRSRYFITLSTAPGSVWGWHWNDQGATGFYVRYSGVPWSQQTLTAPAFSISATPITFMTGGDFDRDHRADPAIFRPAEGNWYVWRSSTQGATTSVFRWGTQGDIPVNSDYDGDVRQDYAVFRPNDGTWYIRYASLVTAAIPWGTRGDRPVPADYDGDGKTDVAVYRPSNGTWYIRLSTTQQPLIITWGTSGDIPVPGDYDGDGKIDVAVFRPSNGTWYIMQSRSGTAAGMRWGASGDIPMAGDFDGDGRSDLTIFRPSNGTWYVMQSNTHTSLGLQWGAHGDVPIAADFDADNQMDFAVFRPTDGTWYVRTFAGTTMAVTWGLSSDVPVLKGP
jgi:hypothetical protein